MISPNSLAHVCVSIWTPYAKVEFYWTQLDNDFPEKASKKSNQVQVTRSHLTKDMIQLLLFVFDNSTGSSNAVKWIFLSENRIDTCTTTIMSYEDILHYNWLYTILSRGTLF